MQAVLSRTDHKLPPPMSAFQGIVGREPYPVAEKAAELIQRLLHLGVARFRALFRGSREPFGGGGHLSGGAGAVQGPAAASGGDGGGLHRDLYRAGGGDGSEATERTEN